MEVNKVDLANGETLIDLTSDTVTPQTLAKGVTAHNSKGEQIIGNLDPEGGGSGGGIIDVTELPTENIDENAVYRVVTNQEQQVYVIKKGQTYTVEQYAVSMGFACYVYWVDELPNNMEVTNTELHLYVLSSNGIGYVAFGSSTNIVPIGQLLFGSAEYDRGYTDNIADETFNGVYVTRAVGAEDWFIRENSEWRQISPNKYKATVELFKYGEITLKPEEGKLFSEVAVVVKAPSTGDIIDKVLEEVTEEYFIKSNGECCYFLNAFPFSGMTSLKKVTIAKGVKNLYSSFENCTNLQTVTFKGTPLTITSVVFSNCPALTTINVPWSYGAVLGAPWGATNATINYNYTGE